MKEVKQWKADAEKWRRDTELTRQQFEGLQNEQARQWEAETQQ